MRKSLSTSVLLLVLCCPAFAGDMLTPPVTTPLPSTTTSVAPSPEDELTDPATVDEPTTQDISVTRIALSLFESLLAII
jgi:hypothetical protein